MKVIVAGFPKTGTTSMAKALEILGYNPVHHFYQSYGTLQNEWAKILKGKWTVDDFRKMYEDVDAVTDEPACYYWEEILKAFPDAKVVLTIRKDEEIWYQSLKKHARLVYDDASMAYFRFWLKFSLAGQRMLRRIRYPSARIIFGMSGISSQVVEENEQLLMMKYRAHNAYVIQTAPKDQLLIYNCNEGWRPLCEFLGVSIPEEPFPYRNKAGSGSRDEILGDPAIAVARKQAWITVGVMSAAAIVVISAAFVGVSRMS